MHQCVVFLATNIIYQNVISAVKFFDIDNSVPPVQKGVNRLGCDYKNNDFFFTIFNASEKNFTAAINLSNALTTTNYKRLEHTTCYATTL